MIDRKNWIYPDEERLAAIINTKEVKKYLHVLIQRGDISLLDFIKSMTINEDTDRH